jgi:hypothetical protein
MATATKLRPVGSETLEIVPTQSKAVHHYHAQAYVFKADLQEPVRKVITPRAQVDLSDDGRYRFKHAHALRVKGILSYRSGYTQVAGHRSTRKGHGFTTLTTSVVEGLNVLDVVTADRVVGQISTEHPLYEEGCVPTVTFLGTRFDNLRISGHPVKIERCLDIIGIRRDANKSYFDDQEVIDRISSQYKKLQDEISKVEVDKSSHHKDAAEWAKNNYLVARPIVQQDEADGSREINCSLVESISGSPGITFGHVIDLPHFGKIYLGELTIRLEKAKNPTKAKNPQHDKYIFSLKMIRLEMGCLAKGTATFSAMDSNGKGSKGSGGGG